MSPSQQDYSVLFFTGLVALLLMAGCTAPMSPFSGIYIREEAPQNFMEFRLDGSVYSVLSYQYKQIGTWSRIGEDLINVCYDSYCYEMGIGNNTLFYFREGKQYTLYKVDKLPEITTEPTRVAVSTAQTPAYTVSTEVYQVGNVIGYASSSRASCLEYILISLEGRQGGKPVDLSQMMVSYSDGSTEWPAMSFVPGTPVAGNDVAGSAGWGIAGVRGASTSENTTTLTGTSAMNILIGLPPTATPGTAFRVVLKMPDGSEIRISRTVPAEITLVNAIY
jgi:hypothetical protein